LLLLLAFTVTWTVADSFAEEAFTSENWIVRIYQVKKEDPFGREHSAVNAFDAGKRLTRSKSQGPVKKGRPSM
jgi:dolichyl-diphosphooligosaccharide--protein glycosyltransferase